MSETDSPKGRKRGPYSAGQSLRFELIPVYPWTVGSEVELRFCLRSGLCDGVYHSKGYCAADFDPEERKFRTSTTGVLLGMAVTDCSVLLLYCLFIYPSDESSGPYSVLNGLNGMKELRTLIRSRAEHTNEYTFFSSPTDKGKGRPFFFPR